MLVWLMLANAASAQTDYIQMGTRERDPARQVEYFTKDLNARANRMGYYQRAVAYLGLNRLNAAMADLLAAREAPQHLNPQYRVDNTFINGVLCYCYFASGNYDQAIEYGNQALAEYPQNETALRFRAWSYLQKEVHELALRDLNAYVAINPSDGERYFLRAVAFYNKKDYEAALTDINKAIELKPSEKTYKERKALILTALGRNDEAQHLIESFVEFQNDDPQSLVNVGAVYANNGDSETAIKYYDRAMELYNAKLQRDPAFRRTGQDQLYNIYINRGNARFVLKDYANALNDYTKAAEVKPTDYLVWYYIGQLQSDRRNFEEAIRAYEKCFQYNPTHPDGWINLGFSYGELHKRTEAIRTYDRALRIPNVSGRGLILNNRGYSYLEMRRFEDCRRDLEEAISVDPEIPMSHISLGEYYIEVEKYDQAIEKFNHALNMPARSDRETLVALYRRGQAYYKKREYQRAIQDLEAATRVRLEHTEETMVKAYELLGICYYETNQDCNAQQMLKKALLLNEETRFNDAVQAPLYLQKVTARNPHPCR
jgi:tetratricopeptide (TPR) repeat protein